MNKFIELKSKNEYDSCLEYCKKLVIENIRESKLCEEWDGIKTNITPEEHFDNIVNWCNKNIKNTVWSSHKSAKTGFYSSYGAKHLCEKDLKCYVANNWMKLAMILSGLEVCHINCVDYESGRVDKYPIQVWSILVNTENFICRRSRNKDDYYSIKYSCMNELVSKEIKYCCGRYEE